MIAALLVTFSYLLYGIGPVMRQMIAIDARVQKVEEADRPGRRRQRLIAANGFARAREDFCAVEDIYGYDFAPDGKACTTCWSVSNCDARGCMSDSERPSAGN
jgi:hypothetical protein